MQAKALDLGTARLTIVDVFPGVAGEAERLEREASRLSPRAIACDVDHTTLDHLRRRKHGVPWLTATLADYYVDLGASEPPERVYQACADLALARQAPLVPLLPPDNLGAIARFRLRRGFGSAEFPEQEARELALAFRKKAEATPELAAHLRKEEEVMSERLFALAFGDQMPGIMAVVSYPRSLRVAGLLVEKAEKALGRSIQQGWR